MVGSCYAPEQGGITGAAVSWQGSLPSAPAEEAHRSACARVPSHSARTGWLASETGAPCQ